MDRQQQLYALALALIPDADAAGDLFMDARDEADLCRRAAAWRRKAGFPPLAPQPDVLDPASLTAGQVEHAAHLVRRAHRRRRLRTAWVIAATGAFVVAAVLLRSVEWLGPTGLAAAPAFARTPVKSAVAPGRYRLSIYDAEATPGAVTVWWALEGPAAARSAGAIRPGLKVPGIAGVTRIAADATQTVGAGRDQVLGRSVYLAPNLLGTEAGLILDSVAAHVVNLSVTAPLTWLEQDPEAKTVQVTHAGPGPAGEFSVQSVTLGPNYTVIRYRSPITLIGGGAVQLVRADAWGVPLQWLGALKAPTPQLTNYQDVFSAVPAGIGRLTIRFTYPGYNFAVTTYDLQRPGEVRDVVRSGSNVEIVVDAQSDAVAAESAYLTDATGHRYNLVTMLRQAVTSTSTFYEYRLRADNIPPDARLVSLGVSWGQPSPPVEVQVDLPQ